MITQLTMLSQQELAFTELLAIGGVGLLTMLAGIAVFAVSKAKNRSTYNRKYATRTLSATGAGIMALGGLMYFVIGTRI